MQGWVKLNESIVDFAINLVAYGIDGAFLWAFSVSKKIIAHVTFLM
jgi:hypothetical protein